MRIPTSTIVMTAVLAVPLVLAIRETSSGSGKPYMTARERARAERVEMEERFVREEEERAAAEQAKKTHADDVFTRVIGLRPAQLGSLFEGVALGAPADSYLPEATRRVIEHAEQDGDVTVSYDVDARTLSSIDVTLHHYERRECASKLDKAWGEQHQGSRSWIDPATHHRAVLELAGSCLLHFELFDTPAEWVAKLPLSAAGSPAKQVKTDPSAMAGDDEIVWHAPGVGAGTGPTVIMMTVVKGKVDQVHVETNTDADSVEAIRDALSARLGSTPTAGDNYRDPTYTWKTHPRVVLSSFEDRLELEIGGSGR